MYENDTSVSASLLHFRLESEKRRQNMETTMRTDISKPTGLALCGGGAKGAFQAGALEVLAARGMLTELRAIAGCSVGALNMVLYTLSLAGKDAELIGRIWKEIRREDLLKAERGGTAIFSREGMIRLLHMLPLELVSASPLQLYVSVWNVTESRAVFHKLNGLSPDRIRTLLMATSALPGAYDAVQYQGYVYMDGGVSQQGNLCIQPLYDAECREILVVSHDKEMYLDGVQNVKLMRGFGKTNLRTQYPDCDLMLLKPYQSLGGLFRGTLNFSADTILRRMEQGRLCAEGFLDDSDDAYDPNGRLIEEMEAILPDGAAFARWMDCSAEDFIPNFPTKTMEGKLWYNDIYERDGWRVQHHRVKGLRGHYRILDPDGVRRAWAMNAEQLIRALLTFRARANVFRPVSRNGDPME